MNQMNENIQRYPYLAGTSYLTSEKAGAVIFRCRFHSSSSVMTMLLPKNESTLYCSSGLGNRALFIVIS